MYQLPESVVASCFSRLFPCMVSLWRWLITKINCRCFTFLTGQDLNVGFLSAVSLTVCQVVPAGASLFHTGAFGAQHTCSRGATGHWGRLQRGRCEDISPPVCEIRTCLLQDVMVLVVGRLPLLFLCARRGSPALPLLRSLAEVEEGRNRRKYETEVYSRPAFSK